MSNEVGIILDSKIYRLRRKNITDFDNERFGIESRNTFDILSYVGDIASVLEIRNGKYFERIGVMFKQGEIPNQTTITEDCIICSSLEFKQLSKFREYHMKEEIDSSKYLRGFGLDLRTEWELFLYYSESIGICLRK